MPLTRNHLRHPATGLIGFLIGLCLYSLFMAGRGGFSTEFLYRQWLEWLLVTYVYTLLYFMQRPGRGRVLLAALPIFLLYLVHDVFYLIYGKVFRFINLTEIPELLQILPPSGAIALVLIFVVPFSVLVYRLDLKRPRWLGLLFLPLLLLVVSIQFSPGAFASGFKNLAFEIVKYSDGKSVENNGRLAMLLYREAQRLETQDRIGPYRDYAQYEAQFSQRVDQLKSHLRLRNVHLIMLESFLDPRLFKKLRFSEPPAHPDFEKRFADKLGLSISPVFGGATAQAEFEVLCGVPAFEKLSSVEFNTFTGRDTHCLPSLLQAVGYHSVASNAYKPNFFNAIAGYRGAGFGQLQFPVEFYSAEPSYLHFNDPGEEDFIFDEELFNQNLAFVRDHLQQTDAKPLFNYMMTIYGHTPHILDPQKRPERIQTQSDHPDDHLQRATNQFYYRSKAIADYVDQLLAIDPNSLIILIADHVPPLHYGPDTYNALGYMDNQKDSIHMNRIAVIEDGQVHRYAPIHHYELPDIVLNYLSQGQHCSGRQCAHLGQTTPTREERLGDYLTLMAHATD